MNQGTLCGVAAALAVAVPGGAAAEPADEITLSLERVVELAQTRAPDVIGARGRVDVARGRLTGARVWQPFDPQLEVGGGPRINDGTRYDVEVGVGQWLELGGRRSRRIDRAEAGIEGARARADDAARQAARRAATSYYRSLHARARLAALRDAANVARALRDAAKARHRAGDVGGLDVDVARAAHARASARAGNAAADLARAKASIRALLALEPGTGIALAGDLGARGRHRLEALLERVPERADLRALRAEVRRGSAERALGDASRWPDLGVFARYKREEGADVVHGGLRLALPLWDSGQELRATGAARARAARLELAAAERRALQGVRGAHEVFARLDRAAAELEAEALPTLEDTLDRVRRAYEAGNLPISRLLVLQRELVTARLALLDLQLEAALAGVRLEAAAGVLP